MLAISIGREIFAQLTMNGIFRGASYGLIGAGFALILGVTGRFHFAYGFTYTLAAYLAYTFHFRGTPFGPFSDGFPFIVSGLMAVLVTIVVGVAIEKYVYRPIASGAGATALLAVFVAALGIGIAGQSTIALLWSQQSQGFYDKDQFVKKTGWHLWKVTFENLDVFQFITSLTLIIVFSIVLKKTSLGRQMKATRVNPDLATVIGINANRIYLICFGIGSGFVAVSAFWYGLQYSVNPDMGARPVTTAFVVAFLAGTASSPVRIFMTGIVLSLLEQWSSMFIQTRWTQTLVFVILFAYLINKSAKGTIFSKRIISIVTLQGIRG
jgi:branched-chain amino acid transport system permease protein